MKSLLLKKLTATFKRPDLAQIFVGKMPIVLFSLFLASLVIGLTGAVVIFNKKENLKENRLEVTFVDPHQALVFWTTEKPSQGYIRYGQSPKSLSQTATQTSSKPGTIHAVLLTEVPLGGVYFSLHTDLDSPVFWPKINHLVFDPSTIQ